MILIEKERFRVLVKHILYGKTNNRNKKIGVEATKTINDSVKISHINTYDLLENGMAPLTIEVWWGGGGGVGYLKQWLNLASY